MPRAGQKFIPQKELLKLQQDIYSVFAPSTPIDDPKMFVGRLDEMLKVQHFVRAPGDVAFIFGPRGIGKTTLAQQAAKKFSSEFGWAPPIFKSCDRDSSFVDLLDAALKEADIDVDVLSQASAKTGGGIKLGYGQVDVSLGTKKSESQITEGAAKKAGSPSFCAEHLADLERICVLDEFDLVEDEDTKRKFSDFLKYLSDARPRFKLVITGIAENAEDLVEVHPSTRKTIKKVKLRGMPPEDLRQIIAAGAKKLKLSFDDDAVDAITEMSAGYARSTHQVARDSALFAVQEGRRKITLKDVHAAVQGDYDLEDRFDDAIRGKNPEEYRNVLIATAKCAADQLTTKDVIASYREHVGGKASEASIRSLIGKMASDDNTKILQRRDGQYVFSDPRMKEYIRLRE